MLFTIFEKKSVDEVDISKSLPGYSKWIYVPLHIKMTQCNLYMKTKWNLGLVLVIPMDWKMCIIHV